MCADCPSPVCAVVPELYTQCSMFPRHSIGHQLCPRETGVGSRYAFSSVSL